MNRLTFSKELVERGVLEQFSSYLHDFREEKNGSVVVLPLRWWDDRSYAAYQGEDPAEGETTAQRAHRGCCGKIQAQPMPRRMAIVEPASTTPDDEIPF